MPKEKSSDDPARYAHSNVTGSNAKRIIAVRFRWTSTPIAKYETKAGKKNVAKVDPDNATLSWGTT